MADDHDLINIKARELAMRGRLIGAGFDPIQVAYSPQLTRWRIVLPLSADDDILCEQLNACGLVVWDSTPAADTVTVTVSELDARESE